MKHMMIALIVAAVSVASLLILEPGFHRNAVGIVPQVHAQINGCTNASLHGIYGYYRTGMNNTVGGPIAAVGLITFDGEGNRSARETISRNGEITEDVDVGGTYTVNSDCTGSMFGADGTTKSNNFVIVDGGNELNVIVTSPGTTVTAVAKKQ